MFQLKNISKQLKIPPEKLTDLTDLRRQSTWFQSV
jgi:hypothetical protein